MAYTETDEQRRLTGTLDATGDGVMPSKDCHVGCHGLWSGWSLWSLHVQCEYLVPPRSGRSLE